MAVNPDFRDLFSAFNVASVRYLLVGGYAVGFHAEIGRTDLVANKRASGRPQDLLDVELLLRHSER